MANILNDQTSPASQNAAKHWCTSQALIVGDEKIEDFNALVNEFTRDYRPRNALDREWVEGAARCLWFVRRSSKAFDNVFNRLCATGPAFESWNEIQHAEYDKMMRYRKADQREFERAYRGVEHLRANLERRLKLKASLKKSRASTEKTKTLTAAARAKIARDSTPAPAAPIPQTPQAPTPSVAEEPELWDQRVFVKIIDGAVAVRIYPTNADFRSVAQNPTTPGTRVSRIFRFPHGVPPAFEWMIAPDDRRPGITCGQEMSLETWLALTAEEERRGEFLDPRKWRPRSGEDLPSAA
jgi:hypothetical protein